MRNYATQMDAARRGIVTPEMRAVAQKEFRTEEEIRQLVAQGQVAICANKAHTCLDPQGVGSMLRTKINVNLGVSRDCKDMNVEMEKVMAAVNGAGRALGYVCAPVLFQKVVAKCTGVTGDISAYERNRELLYNGLTELGYECVQPQGAFYLFVKSPEPDANAFSEKAKKYDVLIVPGDSFGCPGYVRISYCVAEKTIVDAMPAFAKIMEEYRSV